MWMRLFVSGIEPTWLDLFFLRYDRLLKLQGCLQDNDCGILISGVHIAVLQ
jgi:hypothetical protein